MPTSSPPTPQAEQKSEKIFYSWQSDLPNATNRGFIQRALEDAADAIKADQTVEVEPVVDRDTQGVAGSPNIATTIYEKIDQAAVFVADVSIINYPSTSDRLTPNPNVLLELGYALKSLGINRIILVMNKVFGQPEQLPFDLRMNRVVTYHMPEQSEQRAPERKKLQGIFEEALRSIFSGQGSRTIGTVIQPPPLVEQAIQAIEEGRLNRSALTRRYMKALASEINALNPDYSKVNPQTADDLLVGAVNATEQLVADFGRLCESVASMNDDVSAREVYQGFGAVLEGYNLPAIRSRVGGFYDWEFDFYKTIGQELFLVFVGKLVTHEAWKLIGDLLNEGIYVANADRGSGRGASVSIEFIYEPIQLLEHRNRRLKLGKLTLFGDMLNQRHTSGMIGEVAPLEEIRAADIFLFFRSSFTKAPDAFHMWIPVTMIYQRGNPRFINQSVSSTYANRLLPAFNVTDIPTLRTKLGEALETLHKLFVARGIHTSLEIDPEVIGSGKLRS
jgi:hypothetical protein